jgi:hypothetical protein
MDDYDCADYWPKRLEFEQWREDSRGVDEAARRASKPTDIAHAELVLGLMERFNYPNLAAVYEEDTEILYLLECESFGDKADEKEKMEELENETRAESQRLKNG